MISPRSNSGFSLIEVMCCILILGIALVGLTQGMTTALGSSKESELQTAAALFAAGQIEMTRADGEISNGDTDGDCGESLPNCHWRQSITAGSSDCLHEVKLTLENTKTGQTVFELQTMLFDPWDASDDDATTGKKGSAKSKKDKKRK